jgi:hypothetical protein
MQLNKSVIPSLERTVSAPPGKEFLSYAMSFSGRCELDYTSCFTFNFVNDDGYKDEEMMACCTKENIQERMLEEIYNFVHAEDAYIKNAPPEEHVFKIAYLNIDEIYHWNPLFNAMNGPLDGTWTYIIYRFPDKWITLKAPSEKWYKQYDTPCPKRFLLGRTCTFRLNEAKRVEIYSLKD